MAHTASPRMPVTATLVALLLASTATFAQTAGLVAEVRAAIARGDLIAAATMVEADRTRHGPTPENLEALSWVGRGALAARQWDRADEVAQRTYDLAAAELKKRPLDQEPRLPIALGAAIEVIAQAAAAQGRRSEAIAFLEAELGRYRDTSIHKRIQKNINLLGLEGTAAPALDLSDYVGARPPTLGQLRGQVVLLYFWAHWCSDCKAQLPIVTRLAAKYASRGLTLVAPTQRYGYVARGTPAPPAEETRYIDDLRRGAYAALGSAPVPLSEANHKRYGVSSTPTLVLLDRQGIVRLYKPGQMSEDTLEPLVLKLLSQS